jgi:hypothetical protein
VTPWFAAGMGMLVTASLVLGSPTDAVLSYGPPGGSPCRAPGCVRTVPKHGHGSLASRPSIQLEPTVRPTNSFRHSRSVPAPPASPSAGAPKAAPPAVTVSFRVVSQDQRGFIAMITMSSSGSLGDWTLGFTIPGASIKGVGGARWRSGGADSGIAQAQQSPWLRARSGAQLARFMVFGTGVPGRATGCSFDGRDCAFS